MTRIAPATGVGGTRGAPIERRPVRARYHDHERLLCPHALGWKNGRAKVLAYQAAGTTSQGALIPSPHQRWRSMFVEEIEDPVITDDPWQTPQATTRRRRPTASTNSTSTSTNPGTDVK